MITNNTTKAFQLRLEVSESHLRGAWLSCTPPACKYEVYQKEHSMQREEGGYMRHGVLHRKVYDMDGALKNDEFISENSAIMLYPPDDI